MIDLKQYSEVDFYELIGVQINANESEIRKAYRKKALSCHPDKNPENSKAAELFIELGKALEILTDSSARAAYNKILNARKAAKLRNRQLDSKRKKLKDDLERREKEANNKFKSCGYSVNKSDEVKLKEEIERLRREGSKLLEEEQELMRKQLREERFKHENGFNSAEYRIKITWNVSKDDINNGRYTEEILRNYLMKYGDIVAIVMSPKKKGSALVEFKTKKAAEMAIAYEKGDLTNQLSLEWVSQVPKSKEEKVKMSTTITDLDYESLVLRQMRQAEERKKLIEQMMKEDVESRG